jgi:hypothetical protein
VPHRDAVGGYSWIFRWYTKEDGMVDKHDRYYLTPAEKLVMRIIWLSDKEMVLNEILRACNEQYGKNWKSQTVSTYLSHLVQKEYLCMERNGKYCQYKRLSQWSSICGMTQAIFRITGAWTGSGSRIL